MPKVVIAIGGNSLIPDADHKTVQDQYAAAAETDDHIASLIEQGWDVAISHGNGPQVGFILRRSEMSSSEIHEIPLDYCGADTQGAIGYMLQQNLINDLRQRGIRKSVATVVTQVEVDRNDRRALFGEPHGGGAPDPTGAAGHDPSRHVSVPLARPEPWAGRGWRKGGGVRGRCPRARAGAGAAACADRVRPRSAGHPW